MDENSRASSPASLAPPVECRAFVPLKFKVSIVLIIYITFVFIIINELTNMIQVCASKQIYKQNKKTHTN